MKDNPIVRDERSTAVENASYRWGFMVLSFGLLVLVTVRGFLYQESNWDLMGLVILGSLVTTAYQARYRILNRNWIYLGIICAVIAAVVALIISLFTK